MNKKSFIILLLASLFTLTAWAQGHKNLRITEVMVQDTAGGAASGWLELYNSSYGSYAIEKMFITTLKPDQLFTEANKAEAQKTNKTQKNDAVLRYLAAKAGSGVYMIPRGDERNTKVGPRMQVLFQADGHTELGTFHMPFTLVPGQDNYIAVYDVNGDLVDAVTVPATLPVGQSWALKNEGTLPMEGELPASDYEARDGKTVATAITPGNFNTRNQNENIEKFHNGDPHGFTIAIIAMLIVFAALTLLFLLFKLFAIVSGGKKKDEVAPAAAAAEAAPEAEEAASAGNDEIAAICMALYQHFNAHDEESGVLTIHHDAHTDWTNEVQMMTPTPERKF